MLNSNRQPLFKSTFYSPKRGVCRLCGDLVEENLDAFWHKRCLRDYRLIKNPKKMRQFVFYRDGGRCRLCKKEIALEEAEADHIKPLRKSNGRLSYFLPENVRILCKKCHKMKTKANRNQ